MVITWFHQQVVEPIIYVIKKAGLLFFFFWSIDPTRAKLSIYIDAINGMHFYYNIIEFTTIPANKSVNPQIITLWQSELSLMHNLAKPCF